jgi:hypothetical protein
MLEKLKHRLEHLKDRVKPLSGEERDARYDICKSCEYFISATTQCLKCGCIMKVKTTLPMSECPIGKWGKVIRNYEPPQDKKD